MTEKKRLAVRFTLFEFAEKLEYDLCIFMEIKEEME